MRQPYYYFLNRNKNGDGFLELPFFLRLVKNQLKTPVQMHDLDIVHILRGAVPGVAHKATCQEQTKFF